MNERPTDLPGVFRLLTRHLGKRAAIVLLLFAIGVVLTPLVVFTIGVIVLFTGHMAGLLITGIGIAMQLGLHLLVRLHPVNRR